MQLTICSEKINMADFISLTIQPNSTDDEFKEIIVALISDFGFNYFNTEGDAVVAHAKFEDISESEKNDIEEILKPYCNNLVWEFQEKENWNELWEKNFFEPLQIENVHIRAPFHPEVNEGIVITIEPRMSFGTGHHSTTHLMILEMLKNMGRFQDTKVLDMGAGTGILGIVAEKLGASEVVGIEIDDWVVDNANDNLVVNNCTNTVMLLGTAETLANYETNHFDVILANIHREIILADLDDYIRVLKPNGLILISGLQLSDLDMVNDVCISKGLEKQTQNTHKDWGVLGYLKK